MDEEVMNEVMELNGVLAESDTNFRSLYLCKFEDWRTVFRQITRTWVVFWPHCCIKPQVRFGFDYFQMLFIRIEENRWHPCVSSVANR